MRRGVLAIVTAGVMLSAAYGGVADAATTSWSVQAVPLPPKSTFGYLSGVSCTSASSCVAVGTANVGPDTLAAVWNGSTWVAQVPPLPAGGTSGLLEAVSCVSANACVATGFYSGGSGSGGDRPLAEDWNGGTWTAEAPVNPPSVSQNAFLDGISCTSASSCVAVGSYSTAPFNGQRATLAEEWDGSTWTLLKTITPAGTTQALNGVSCVSVDDCVAVGDYIDPSIQSHVLIEGWNGGTWTRQFARNPASVNSTQVTGVSCTAADHCIAVGYGSATSGGVVLMAERWNGSHWVLQAIPKPSAVSLQLSGVSCATSDSCIAVGSVSGKTLAERFNGHTWFTQATARPELKRAFNGVSCVPPGTCTAVGTNGPGATHQSPLAEQN